MESKHELLTKLEQLEFTASKLSEAYGQLANRITTIQDYISEPCKNSLMPLDGIVFDYVQQTQQDIQTLKNAIKG